jgi:hypothetical protein
MLARRAVRARPLWQTASVSSDSPPDLHMLNAVVRDMAASPDFYRRLGIAVPASGDAAGAPVQLKMPGGFSLELDTAESARLWHAGWRADPASAKVVLGFIPPARQDVDDRYAELTSAGYRGRQPPFDAFWGPGTRSWPIPTATTSPDEPGGGIPPDMAASSVPRILRPVSACGAPPDGYCGGSRSLPCPDAGRREMPRYRARNIRSRVRK